MERKVTVGTVKDPILYRKKERKEGDRNKLKKLISETFNYKGNTLK